MIWGRDKEFYSECAFQRNLIYKEVGEDLRLSCVSHLIVCYRAVVGEAALFVKSVEKLVSAFILQKRESCEIGLSLLTKRVEKALRLVFIAIVRNYVSNEV